MKNVIFLSGLFPDELRDEIEKKSVGIIQYAADALQWAIVKGLDLYFSEVKIVTLPYIGSYPSRYKRFRIKSFNFSHRFNANDKNIGFCNLTLYKLYSRYINARKALKNNLKGIDAIIIYSIHTPFIKAAIDMKKKNPNLKICLIVPDLPEFMGGSNNILHRVLKRKEKGILDKLLKKIDAFVVLSDYMYQPLNIDHRPWARVEGIFNTENNCSITNKEGYKTILYTGTLAKRYGIMDLLTAFSLIEDDDYRLWICGDGDAGEEIKQSSQKDKRILFFGQMKREEVLELQKRATVLVNPRKSGEEYTKYSFPSKIMEYFASGTPCIMHRLGGIPEEYFDYCFIPEDETPDSLSKMIMDVCEKEKTELLELGLKSKQFILDNKSSEIQCLKIYNLLINLN